MPENERRQLFEDQPVRIVWDAQREERYFFVVDVVEVLTDPSDLTGAGNYWRFFKKRLKDESSQLVTNCNQLN